MQRIRNLISYLTPGKDSRLPIPKEPEPQNRKAYYTYTGPNDTRELDNWVDEEAYKDKKQKTPTGSIYIKHPDIEMLCRVTDNMELPGFIITCKDNEGKKREFHLYLNPHNSQLSVCTSNETDRSLPDGSKIRKGYFVPFIDNGFEPVKVSLTNHGRSIVWHSAAFREAIEDGHVYQLTAPDENGKVKIGADINGIVITFIHESDVIR